MKLFLNRIYAKKNWNMFGKTVNIVPVIILAINDEYVYWLSFEKPKSKWNAYVHGTDFVTGYMERDYTLHGIKLNSDQKEKLILKIFDDDFKETIEKYNLSTPSEYSFKQPYKVEIEDYSDFTITYE